MKPVVLAVALTGLLSVTALAGNIPTNDATAPGNIPTSAVAAPGEIPTNDVVSQPSSASSGALANLVLTIVQLINR